MAGTSGSLSHAPGLSVYGRVWATGGTVDTYAIEPGGS